jgi:hypothetical protein
MQSAEPVTVLYVPTPQGVHDTPSDGVVYPARHMQSAEPVTFLYVPTPQGVHDTPLDKAVYPARHIQSTAPVTFLYVPTPHGVHATLSYGAVYPAWQIQVRLLVSKKVLAGHVIQLVDADTEKLFPSHGMHLPTPVLALYVPTAQGVHDTPSDEAV